MAGFFNALDKGLTQLSQSPAGMAGMGLLMMPSQSFEPINPMEYAARGMQMGVQNRQRAQLLEQQQAENARQEAQYLMEFQEYQDRVLKAKQEETQQKAMLDAIGQFSMGLDPVQRLAFDAQPLSEKAKIIAAQQFPTPQQPTNTARNLEAAGLKPGTPEFQAEMLKTIQRPQVQVNTGDKPLSVNEMSGLQFPPSVQARPGMTYSQAAAAGATVRPPEPKAPTEGQSVSAGFYERMNRAHQEFSPALEQEIIKPTQAMLSGAPLGNYLVSPAYQVASNIQRDFVTANLRKESGAVIADEEMKNEIKKYFPQLGDKPEVIERKRRLRETAIQAMRANSGKAIQQSGSSMTTPAGTPVTTDMQSGGYQLSPAGQAAYEKYAR